MYSQQHPPALYDLYNDEAEALEKLQRRSIDYLKKKKYSLVSPCLIDDAERFSARHGDPQFINSFVVVDPMTGRRIVFHPDVTPQVARMDLKLCRDSYEPRRLCYSSHVFSSHTTNVYSRRDQIQIGAELFGVKTNDADIEIVDLCCNLLKQSRCKNITLAVGDVWFFRTLIDKKLRNINQNIFKEVLRILHSRSHSDVNELSDAGEIPGPVAVQMHYLIEASGNRKDAIKFMKSKTINALVKNRLQVFDNLIRDIEKKIPWVNVQIDFGELHNYHYKSGFIFSAYIPEHNDWIARGGRYDGVYSLNNVPRPAIGFSTVLDRLSVLHW